MGPLWGVGVGGWKPPKFAYGAGLASLTVATLGIGYLGFSQTRSYLRAVRSPDNASFAELKSALRGLVPEGVCPVAVREPVLWLAFPEYDLCFASIQPRTRKAADIDGKEFAMIVARGEAHYWVEQIASTNHHLLGTLNNTPYGSYEAYYTGTDPRWKALEPLEYQFFDRKRGYVSGNEIAGAREIWSADPSGLKQCGAPGVLEADGLAINLVDVSARRNGIIELCALELKPDTIYQASVEGNAEAQRASLVILREKNGAWVLDQIREERDQASPVAGLFRTDANNQFKIGLRPMAQGAASTIKLTRLSIREVASVYR
jgi:hypothetical protein